MGGHSVEQLRAFFDIESDTRNVWARDLRLTDTANDGDPAAAVVHMPDGEADRFKPDTKAGHLVCLLPDCPTPLLNARGGATGRRHHWAHRTAPNPRHEPESLWHVNAKAALASWVRECHPGASVHPDDRRTPGRNKPDVWVRSPWVTDADGNIGAGWSVAFEVQASAIDVRELARRNGRYGHDQIVPVWLFRSTDRLELAGRPPSGVDIPVRLRPMHSAVAGQTGRLRWFNPSTRQVATAVVSHSYQPEPRPGERWWTLDRQISFWRYPTAADTQACLRMDALDDCTVGPTGLRTPTDAWLDRQSELAAEAEDRLRAQAREASATAARIFRERYGSPDGPPASGRTPAGEEPARAGRTGFQASLFPDDTEWEAPTARPASRVDGEGTSSGPRRHEQSAPQRLAEPCPACGGVVQARSEGWPTWFIPPLGATQVAVCTECDLPFALPPAG